MGGLVLVARAYASNGQPQGVLQVLSRAEETCAAEAVEAKGKGGGRQRGGGEPAARLQPPAELYEVAARTLARTGMWEEAASTVRRLEVGVQVFSYFAPGVLFVSSFRGARGRGGGSSLSTVRGTLLSTVLSLLHDGVRMANAHVFRPAIHALLQFQDFRLLWLPKRTTRQPLFLSGCTGEL